MGLVSGQKAIEKLEQIILSQLSYHRSLGLPSSN